MERSYSSEQKQRRLSRVGSTIGNYEILKLIGEGGMGSVFLAEHVLIKRRAAIKVLRPELSKEENLVRRFFNEARATTAIDSPGIVQIFDFGSHDDGTAYIVMELLEGESLGARIKRGALPVKKALQLMRQICSALAEAHARGIIHRDLKPENIHLVADKDMPGGERTKILDFGIAKVMSDHSAAGSSLKTQAGTLMGSPVYMSPEQCRGQEVDHRSDVYALGCILFEMLTGRMVFDGLGTGEPSIGEVFAAHLYQRPPAPSSVRAGLPDEVDALVLRCLEKRVEDRMSSCAAMLEVLDEMIERLQAPDLEPKGGAGNARRATMMPHAWLPGSSPAPLAAGARALEQIELSFQRSRSDEILKAALPTGLKRDASLLLQFFAELFDSAERAEDGLVRLHPAATIKDLAQRKHFAIFLDDLDRRPDEPLTQLQAQALQSKLSPLADALPRNDAPRGSVLIVVTAASQLGEGSHEVIFKLRRDNGIFVVPLALPEIQRVTGRHEARLLLLNRIADLRSVSDPFTILEQSTDPTRCVGFASQVSELVKHISAGGRVVKVIGPPGAGKSTVLAMAEYGCAETNVQRKYIHLNCTELPHRDPLRAALELRDRAWRARMPLRQPFETTIIHAPEPAPANEASEASEVSEVSEASEAREAREPEAATVAASPLQATLVVSAVSAAATPMPLSAEPAPTPVPSDPSGIRATLMQLLSLPERLPEPPRQKRRAGTSPEEPQLVLVLEDADWLIRMSSATNPDDAGRAGAMEFWRALFELCKSNGHTALVTCVRGLHTRDQAPGEKQLAFERIQLNALSRAEADRVVVTLGGSVGLQFSRWALRRLYRESGGNVYALRRWRRGRSSRTPTTACR